MAPISVGLRYHATSLGGSLSLMLVATPRLSARALSCRSTAPLATLHAKKGEGFARYHGNGNGIFRLCTPPLDFQAYDPRFAMFLVGLMTS